MKTRSLIGVQLYGHVSKKAKQEERWIVFCDETGLMLQPNVRRTWAPRGQTPIVQQSSRHDRLSAISALAYNPKEDKLHLLFRIQRENFTSASIVSFLSHLRRALPSRLLLIWDNISIHRSVPVKDFLKRYPGHIHIEPLPAYAPELNPVEGIWGHTKNGDLAHLAPYHVEQLEAAAKASFRRKRFSQKLLRSFFKLAKLQI